MSLITISAFTFPAANIADGTYSLRCWYNQGFLDSTGQLVLSGTATTGTQFRFAATALNGIVTVSAVALYSTLDADVPNPQSILVSSQLFRGNASLPVYPFNQNGTQTQWIVPDDLGGSITFETWTIANQRIVLANPPQTFYTAAEVDALIHAIQYAPATISSLGIVEVTHTPTNPLIPKAVETTDPRLTSAFNILSYGAATTNTAAQNATAVTAAVVAAALAGAGIYVPAGTFLCNTVSITVPITFADGGILSAPTGQTITYTKSLTAGISQHFAGLGSHVFSGKNLAILYPQYWGIANDGTTVDTVPFQAFVDAVNNSHAVGYLTPKSTILLGTVTTVNTARGFSLTSGLSARNFNPNAPQLIWNGTGGTMFDFEQGQQVEIKGIYFKNGSGKSIDSFIKFDGNPTSQIGTQGTVKYCSFDASNQLNASAKLISISPTASSNHENYYVGYCDFYGSSGIRATAVGKAIENGNSANAKHQRFEYLTISNCAIGIDVLAGSADISHIGGGSNGIGIKVGSSATEPTLIDHYEAEGDLQAVVVIAGGSPVNCTNCRWSNANQTNAGGFLKFGGLSKLDSCKFENAPPVGGILIEDQGTGGMRLFIVNTDIAPVTTAQLGITQWALASGSSYFINPTTGIIGATTNVLTSESWLLDQVVSAGITTPFEIQQVWPTGTADVQNGILLNVSDVGTSAVGSNLLDLQVAGVSKFKVNKSGAVVATTLADSALTSGRVVIAGAAGLLADDSDLTFASDTLSATKVAMSSLTSGRVPIVSTAGLLIDDADLTFATDTLTATKFAGALNGTVGATTPAAATGTTVTGNTAIKVAATGKLTVAPKVNDSWAATIALDVTISNHVITAVFGTSATATINGSAGGSAGDMLFISTENGAGGSVVVTFGTNFKTSGTQTTQASRFSTIVFQSDGTRFLEISRTTDLV